MRFYRSTSLPSYLQNIKKKHYEISFVLSKFGNISKLELVAFI